MPIFVNERNLNVLYVHVPKTGGTYVEDLFKHNGFARAYWEGHPKRLGLICSPQHYHRAIYEQLFTLGEFACRFMTIRNPIDRLLSEYRNQAQKSGGELYHWITKVERELAESSFAFDNHLRPQVEFFHPLLEVYKQEDGFGPDWVARMNVRFGFEFEKFEVRRRRNTSVKQKPLTMREQDLLIDFCRHHYADDFDFFNYSPEQSSLICNRKSG